MIRISGECGVVEQSTPHNIGINLNYTIICFLSYLNHMVLNTINTSGGALYWNY